MTSKTLNLSREELLAVIDSQADQIKRFELRLRDTVSACKSLIKQKEALEASLHVLNQQKRSDDDLLESTETSRTSASEVGSFTDGSSLGNAIPSNAADGDITVALRQQISTLSQSLATITTEKVRLEQLIIAEKRSLRAEYEAKIDASSAEKDRLTEEIRELRMRLSVQQQSNSHLNSPVSGDVGEMSPRRERPHRVSSEQQLRESIPTDSYQPGLPLVERLRTQLKETEARLFVLQQTCIEKDAEVNALEAERERADRAEILAGSSEVRLRVLEQRIAELTSEIGRCEVASVKDKAIIDKLEAKLRDSQQAVKSESKVQGPQPQLMPLTRATATFGTQTDLPVSFIQTTSPPPSLSKPAETEHAFCRERIATLEGALAMARKDFADAVTRSWFASAASHPSSNCERAVFPDNIDRTPDLLLGPMQQGPSDTEPKCDTGNQSHLDDNNKQSCPAVCLNLPNQVLDIQDGNDLDRHSAVLNFSQESAVDGDDAVQVNVSNEPLLFYETEMSRLSSALRETRAANRKMERRFRETEQRLTAEKLELQFSFQKLKAESEELRRAARNLPPDSAKLEFVRQVAMRHLSSTDSKVRAQTATVLATALSFPSDFAFSSGYATAGSSSTAAVAMSNNLSRFFKS